MSRRPSETVGGVFIYPNLKGGVPYLLPAIGLAFFISRKGGLTLVDDKKNIGPEVETYRADITKNG